MEIYTTHPALDLVETDIIKALKTRAGNRPYAMIGDKKMLFPAHEYVLSLHQSGDMVAFLCLLVIWSESIELSPVLDIHLVGGSPVCMRREKGVFRADYLTLEICCESWMVFGQSFNIISL